MHCALCGTYINPDYAQRVVSPEGKLVLACKDGRLCEQEVVLPELIEPVIKIAMSEPKKIKVRDVAKEKASKFVRPWK